MAETTLQARLGLPGASTSPKKPWKKQKPHLNDHQEAEPSWPSRRASFEPVEAFGASTNVSPSLIDRLGPKISPPVQPKSLLERMELDDNAPTEIAVKGAAAAGDPFLDGGEDAKMVLDNSYPTVYGYAGNGENGEVMSQAMPQWNRPPPVNGTHLERARSSPPVNGTRSALSERVNGRLSEAPAVNDNYSSKTQPLAMNGPVNISADPGPTTDASGSPKRPPMPLEARIGRVLRSAVLQNAKLREQKSGTFDSHKVQSRIDIIVTESVVGAFDAQMKKVKQEMNASRTGNQREETLARSKGQLLNGFGNKSGAGEHSDNTWLNRRDSHSLIHSLASTSILPTPPPSENPATENMEKGPPKAPRAMLGISTPPIPPKSISLKGKEKAIEPADEDANGTMRRRRSSFGRPSLGASPMNHVAPDVPPRRASASPPPTSTPRKRSFAKEYDQLPAYRSPERKGSLRSRSPLRTDYSRSPVRSGRRSHSRSEHPRAVSHTRSFNSRRPRSSSRSPPPPPSASYSSYSNGFRTRPPQRASRPRSTSRGRTFSDGKPRPPYHGRSRSRSPAFNTRYGLDKRPFVRSPSPLRGRRSRSPPPRKRKLTHHESRSRSRSAPWPGRRPRSPSFGSSHGRGPGRRGFDEDRAYSTPRPRNYAPGGYEDSPNQLMSPFGPPSHSARPPDSSPAPPPHNPCNNVPGLWFVKVGADATRVVEGRFVVEPEFAAAWGLGPNPSSSSITPAQPKLQVLLLCLSTQGLNDLYNSLIPSHPTPEMIATAAAGLQTAWPQDGSLFVGMNVEGTGGRTWLPYQMDPSAPLDVTHHILPGLNIIRFIQLANMVERTFILYAARRPPPPPSDAALSRFFQPSASQSNSTPALLHFAPSTVSVSYSADSFL
ncbi:hypothetical protein B0H16DRAFT_1512403 [Mycena metata]|uniref:Uncharacterized protein n=1 Tax=Mycena metata TaxID=1033252 RepID=A0AAD7NSS7_9AGAR|nr:hypothetical protein B0H16DRAFT_1512403 [Mycena metata]